MDELNITVVTFVFIGILLIIAILPNLWSIWHIFHCDFKSPLEKGMWLLLAVFIPVIGGLVYCIWGRKRGTRVI